MEVKSTTFIQLYSTKIKLYSVKMVERFQEHILLPVVYFSSLLHFLFLDSTSRSRYRKSFLLILKLGIFVFNGG